MFAITHPCGRSHSRKKRQRSIQARRSKPWLVLWPVASDAAKAEIKNDPALGKQLAAMKEKEGDYFLQALDARTGKADGAAVD